MYWRSVYSIGNDNRCEQRNCRDRRRRPWYPPTTRQTDWHLLAWLLLLSALFWGAVLLVKYSAGDGALNPVELER
jgi:hypothetical protein